MDAVDAAVDAAVAAVAALVATTAAATTTAAANVRAAAETRSSAAAAPRDRRAIRRRGARARIVRLDSSFWVCAGRGKKAFDEKRLGVSEKTPTSGRSRTTPRRIPPRAAGR